MLRKRLLFLLPATALLAAALLYIFFRRNEPPSADFVAEPSLSKPLEVVFDASRSHDPDGKVRDYTWDFGDGQTATGQPIQHTYGRAGEFTVTLTITDNRGMTNSISQEVVAYRELYKLPVPEQWASLSKPAASRPPLFTEIDPADGTAVRGTETWIRWSPGGEAEGRVLWHKAGEAEVRVSAATGADLLLARLQPLEIGQKYEYVVEQISGNLVQRSNLRSFTVEGGVVFDPPIVQKTVQRDYDQTVTLTLRNDTKEPVKVAAKALKQFDDLPADIVGPGSVDDPVERLEPGKTLDLRLAVFAMDASRDTYEIPVEAAGAVATARVTVEETAFDLGIRVIDKNRHTLAQTIEVHNRGDTISNLFVEVAPPHRNDLRLQPSVQHARLAAGEKLHFTARPVLYLEFKSLEADLILTAAGKQVRQHLKFEAPPQARLIGVRSHTTISSSNIGGYCWNNPNTCTTVDGPSGNGPALPPDMIGSAAKLENRWGPNLPIFLWAELPHGAVRLDRTEESRLRIIPVSGKTPQRFASVVRNHVSMTGYPPSPGSRFVVLAANTSEGEAVRLTSEWLGARNSPPLLAEVLSADGRPGAAANESSGSHGLTDSNSNDETQPNQGKCEDSKCTQKNIASPLLQEPWLQTIFAPRYVSFGFRQSIASRSDKNRALHYRPTPQDSVAPTLLTLKVTQNESNNNTVDGSVAGPPWHTDPTWQGPLSFDQACRPKPGSCSKQAIDCARDCWQSAKDLKQKYNEVWNTLRSGRKYRHITPGRVKWVRGPHTPQTVTR
jgi:PKD repeat protein